MSTIQNKIIVNVSRLDDIEKFKEAGVTTFLFPLEDYSVGYETFSLETIATAGVDAYLLINRLLTDEDIDSFLKLDIPSNVKGMFIEDTGLFYALKSSDFEMINFQNHLNNNFKTVNYWLNYFDSLVLSTDISAEEAAVVVESASKPLVVYAFGYPEIMYSRRHLLSNYFEYMNNDAKSSLSINIPNNETSFILKESEYGTVVFPNKPLDARDEVLKYNQEKIKFFLFDTNMIETETVLKAIALEDVSGFDKGFLHKKTIYRVGDIK